ncbi:carbohydrate ABC transporter permease [Cohnella herbarum]|uniref:Carbohydrate ABC transporter permease n=1 Tax=Cohnella herbarum TaxID=2728023 RepID=A0A7Z2ZJM8_9BACL|nr:carbohydrate ABC transporter permease [Cohnella herbarum]QJD82371.1 carbohydrate ABC transporter permease [Cohnella herbarum]
MPRKNNGYSTFEVFNYGFLSVLSLLCILPLLHIFAVSLSSRAAATGGLVTLWPIDFTTAAYMETFGNDKFSNALFIGIERTVLGTVVSMVVITLAAYSLSKRSRVFPGRGVYAWYLIFTMLFNGGIVPTYLIVSETHLTNSIWALVIPGAVNVWNLILMINFFRSIPAEMEEAAVVDGAGHIQTLVRVFLPVSAPVIATLSLFTMVTHWNSFFDGIIYLTKPDQYPLSTFLHTIIVQENFNNTGISQEKLAMLSNRTVKASQIFVSAIPILLVYPFLQKYFVKGIMIGSVKE